MSKYSKYEPTQIETSMAKLEDSSIKNYFALFPGEDTLRNSLQDAFIINRPMAVVGGDGYWVHQKGKFIFLAVFDCMGHGHLASMMTRIYTNALKKVVVEMGDEIPGSILEQVHEEIKVKFESKQQMQLGTGADCGIVKVNTETRDMEYAGAKMDLWQIVNGELNEIKADRMQVGWMFEHERTFKTVKVALDKSKAIKYYLSSDGLRDLFGGPNGKKLGKAKVKELLEKNHTVPLNKQKEVFTKFIENWSGSNAPLDDVLVVGFSV